MPEKKNKRQKITVFSTFGIGKEKDFFIENLSLLMSSGIDVISAINSIEEDIKTSGMKMIIAAIKEDLEAGTALSKALENAKIFPDFVNSLIKVGEQSGKLPENLQLIINQQKKERTFRSKVKSALMYPALVLSLSVLVGIGISWFILPKLATVFSQLNIKLPWITKVLISFGTFMGQYGIIVVPALIIFLILIVYFLFVFTRTKFIGQKMLLSFPGVKRLIQEVELARLGYVLGILLDAGVPIVHSINALANSAGFYDYKKLYVFIAERVKEGNSIQKSLSLYKKSRKLIPGAVSQIVSAGEKSGNLPQALMRIGQIYEEKTDNTTKNLTTLLEPVLLVIVWLGVVFVALAVILPIYSLVGGFNTDPQSAQETTPPITEAVSETIPVETQSTGENPEITPDASAENISENNTQKTIEIMETGTGFLNVRGLPSKTGKKVGQVKPGDKFEILEEQESWYRIKFDEEKEGWVSGEYAEKIDNNDENNSETASEEESFANDLETDTEASENISE
jgi:type IV pilus assembly protein PilC